MKVESFFPLLFLVSLLFVGCTNESEFDKQTKGSMVDLSVKLGMPQGAVQSSGVSGLSDPQIDNIRIMVFSDGGVIDVNKKFDVCRDSYSLTARVGNNKRVVVVANAKGELDTKLSTILFYRDLKKLTLNPITTLGEDFDKVLVGETSEFALASSGKTVGVELVRAYAKILLYMYKSNDPQDPDDPIHAEVKINKIEFLNMASLSPLFPDYNSFWDNLTKGQLNTYSKDYSGDLLKCGAANPNSNLSILEYDTSKEKLTDRQIEPIIVYLPYEQMSYTQKGSRETDFKDFAPRIVVHATYNGIETRYFVPRNGEGRYKYSIKRNNQYYFFGKVSGLGDETNGIIVTTHIVDWDHQEIYYKAAPSFIEKAEVFVQSFDKSGRLNESKVDEGPVQIGQNQKVKVVLKVKSEEAGAGWVASLSDALNFKFDGDDSGVVGKEQTLIISSVSTKAKNTFLTLQVGDNPVLNEKDNTPFKLQIEYVK